MKRLSRSFALGAGLLLATVSIALAPLAQARTLIEVGIGVAPPPPHYVRVPPPRPGYVWAPGYWRWDAPLHRHVWMDGYWEPVRVGYRYRPARWVHRGPDWRFVPGHWAR